MNNDPRIDELYSTLTLDHAMNINREAFNDISNVLLSFHDSKDMIEVRSVCNASMGHGKSTVLTSYLKWITKQNTKQPVLVAIREKQLAHEIYKDVSNVAPNSILNIDSDNRSLFESNLHKYQIVIIQHQRLKNLALGFGNADHYSYYTKDRIKRQLIIDEKPDFVDSAIFDIVSRNNVLDWFDDLAKPFNDQPRTIQKHKSFITFLLSEQLADNPTDITKPLYREEDISSERSDNLNSILDIMKDHEENKMKYDSLNKLLHFKKLLTIDGYGRIDDYSFGISGRKIIVSKFIDYSKLGMNILVFDGTTSANGVQYAKGKFKAERVENRNDYSRLTIQVDKINTSLYSRSKQGNPTQITIAQRINELRKIHSEIFVLPTKDEVKLYINEGAIKESDIAYYYDEGESHTKGINLLNTVGKNVLNDKTELYLTCLPKKNSDHYKEIAIALYGNDFSLLTSEDSDNSNWFHDPKLEQVYKGDLYSELLQIIHRTSLRKIDSKTNITIYIAFDDEPNYKNFSYYEHESIIDNLNRVFLKEQVNTPKYHKLIDMSQYGRDKKLEGYANKIVAAFEMNKNINQMRISKVNKSFSNYIRKHWGSKSHEINVQLGKHGFKVIEQKDRYSDNSKYIAKI